MRERVRTISELCDDSWVALEVSVSSWFALARGMLMCLPGGCYSTCKIEAGLPQSEDSGRAVKDAAKSLCAYSELSVCEDRQGAMDLET